jgi:hypothetical protein
MADSTITIIHDEVKAWIEAHDGSPAIADNQDGRAELAINFGDYREFEPISWDEFFDHFDTSQLAFQFRKKSDIEDNPEDEDEYAYSFIDRHLTPSEGGDEDGVTGLPLENIPRENMNPSSSWSINDPDNMGEEDDDLDESELEDEQDAF